MPDNVKVLAAAGDDTVAPPIATDLVGGQHYQRIKVGFGADGTYNEADDVVGKRLPIYDPVHIPATASDCGTASGTDIAIGTPVAGLRFMGFSARETTATAGALFHIRHGTSNSDPVLVTVSLGLNESCREWYGPDGITAPNGIWLERVTGTIQVTGYMKVVP